jgi:RND family efflux transporter MFP subunit
VEAVYATGAVEPVHWAKVAPVVTGRLVAINARDNQAVRKGDVLARLDDREARAKLAELQARVAFLSQELQRLYSLHERRVISEKAYQQTISDHAAAVAAVAAAEQRLKDFSLVAPLDGTVLRQDGNIGEVVAAGEVIFWVGRAKPLRVTAEVDEEDIVQVRPGQLVWVKADAFPRQPFRARVAEITPKGDPVNKVYRVRIRLGDETPLKIGMTAEVNIETRRKKNALLIPIDALDGDVVWIVQKGRARRRRVTVGMRGAELAEILNGLDDKAWIIVRPPKDLKDGQRVDAALQAAR